jgi:hypothetical protein
MTDHPSLTDTATVATPPPRRREVPLADPPHRAGRVARLLCGHLLQPSERPARSRAEDP